jgi:hypothetical protein
MAAATFSLSLHADYRCGRSGACCTSGWTIAVEPEIEDGLHRAAARGALRLPGDRRLEQALQPRPGLPGGAASVLATDACGRCAFFTGDGLCAIHRDAGHEALPASCRHFPRVALLMPAGVALTLSHYCPTAAGALFRETAIVTIVRNPPAFPPQRSYEGLDARHGPGPLLRPGVLLGWDGLAEWEGHAVALLGDGTTSPEAALARLAAEVEAARAWSPRDGPLVEHLRRVCAAPPVASEPPSLPLALELWEEIVAAVPAGLARPGLAADPAAADARWAAGLGPAVRADRALPRRARLRELVRSPGIRPSYDRACGEGRVGGPAAAGRPPLRRGGARAEPGAPARGRAAERPAPRPSRRPRGPGPRPRRRRGAAIDYQVR